MADPQYPVGGSPRYSVGGSPETPPLEWDRNRRPVLGTDPPDLNTLSATAPATLPLHGAPYYPPGENSTQFFKTPGHRQPQARMTVVGVVYHQRHGRQPESVDLRFGRDLDSGDRPYVREVSVSNEWQPLDRGWVDRIGYVVIVNDPPFYYRGNPAPAEKAAAEAARVEVYCCPANVAPSEPDDGDWLVNPGEQFAAAPAGNRPIYLRCRVGRARVTTYVFPR